MSLAPHILLLPVACAALLGCGQPHPDANPLSLTEQQAIDHLTSRGHTVNRFENGTCVALASETESREVTVEDIHAVNSLSNVTEIRVIAFHGIQPEVMKEFRTFPEVTVFGIHYQMPAESVRYLDRFPNVQTLELWADYFISLQHLPVLSQLTYLHHDSTDGEFTLADIQSIVACRNLEEIIINLPVSEEGVTLLKTLPHWKTIEIGDTFFKNPETPAPAN